MFARDVLIDGCSITRRARYMSRVPTLSGVPTSAKKTNYQYRCGLVSLHTVAPTVTSHIMPTEAFQDPSLELCLRQVANGEALLSLAAVHVGYAVVQTRGQD